MKKWLGSLFFILVLSLVLAACGGSDDGSKDEGAKDDGDNSSATEEKTEIAFWHAMSGDNGKAIETIVDEFNAQSDAVTVKAIYQGSYDDSLNKLRAVGGSSEAPAIVQVFEIGTKYMSESGFITPMQEFIDKDEFDVSALEENILSYYTLEDQLYSMPFNTSGAVMFYNKEKFEEAGLDPENPPTTFTEVKEAAEKLTNDTDLDYGFTMATIGWFVEQLLANQGALYLDHENGRDGDATEAVVNSEEGLAIFEWLDEMNKNSTFKNYGSSWDDPRGPFFAGQVGMYFDSTANTAEVIKNAPFEVGSAPMPGSDTMDRQGSIVGGASLWITNQVDEADQDAAWEFVKFMTKPEVQAEWAAATGYFPITPAAYDEETLTSVYDEYPQFKVAVGQLENTVVSPATQGPLTEVMPEARKIIETELGEMYEGKDPKEAVDSAAKKITDALK
jgi:sn-glycerol 3-phosphate transport system substrate-binding protein